MLQKPGQDLVFLPIADSTAMAECLVALANAAGGLIVLGLDEDGQLTVPVWEDEAEGAFRQAMVACRPQVMAQWQRLEWGQARLIGIRVARSPELHALADGRVLVRHGVENRPITGDELHQLASSHSTGDYEAEIVPGARREDFDPDVLAEYLARRQERAAARVDSLDALLFDIGAIDRSGRPTVGGILLFGRNPQAFLPHSNVVSVQFSGAEPGDIGDGSTGHGPRQEFNGPLVRVIEQTWNSVWKGMHLGARIPGLEREEITEYPAFAVREAIINAVCHRDYRIKGRRVEIRKYSDRLEVISPGGLPGYMTLDNLVQEHFSRNPRLVSSLYYWGLIEELGLGIDRMIEEMVQYGHPPPTFKATPYSFTVTLTNIVRETALPRWTQSMNERQARALAYVRENGSITNGEYQRLCEGISAESLRRDLADLVTRGILLKIGSKKGTYYILK